MSTLTKVLIVLLTVASIFLCGVVVTYVASADNYKQKYDRVYSDLRAARQNEDAATEQFNDLKKRTDEEKLASGAENSALQQERDGLKVKLTESEREKSLLLQKVNNWTSVVADFGKTNENQAISMQKALDAQNKLSADLIQESARLEGATAALLRKSAIIAQLEAKLKGLVEDKGAMQSTLDRYLRQFGKNYVQPASVTRIREAVRITPPATNIDLKGSLIAVDLKNHLAEISIGAADGVKEGMRFHATRGSKFVCDIVILEVEPEKAVGWLELLQPQPQNQPIAGDAVSTNL